MQNTYGPLALLGSGETSQAGGRIFETLARRFSQPLRIAILETPAGFELNSNQVAGRVGDFLKTRLQNYDPQVEIVPARKLGSPYSPDDPHILEPLLSADLIFMGAGSPTYAVRQLKGSLAWDLVRLRHRLGAALVCASASVIALGAYSVPVYEIYKVGQDVSIGPGLDLFADFNLALSLVPHWNNTDGGDDVDTSRCFIGLDRFDQWCKLLPLGHTTLGLDEHTGIMIDFTTGLCSVSGVSSVTLLRACKPEIYPAGAEFPILEVGEFRLPLNPSAGISDRAWEMVKNSSEKPGSQAVPIEVSRLAEARRQARNRQDWAESDRLRSQINALGWQVRDTAEKQVLFKLTIAE